MKLYTFAPAPNPRRVAAFLRYKGIAIETEEVDFLSRQQFSEEFRRINPQCTVPVLVLDDGTCMTEVVGICYYLEARYPARPLLGSSPLEQAQVLSWMHRLYFTVASAIADVFRNSNEQMHDRGLPGPLKIAQIPALIERGSQRLDSYWQELEELVPATGFLVGEQISMADVDLYVCNGFAKWVDKQPPDYCQRLRAYLGRVKAELA